MGFRNAHFAESTWPMDNTCLRRVIINILCASPLNGLSCRFVGFFFFGGIDILSARRDKMINYPYPLGPLNRDKKGKEIVLKRALGPVEKNMFLIRVAFYFGSIWG